MTSMMSSYEEQGIFNFLAKNLSIDVVDKSEGTTCGGEVSGSFGFQVRLLLTNPEDGKQKVISEKDCWLVGAE